MNEIATVFNKDNEVAKMKILSAEFYNFVNTHYTEKLFKKDIDLMYPTIEVPFYGQMLASSIFKKVLSKEEYSELRSRYIESTVGELRRKLKRGSNVEWEGFLFKIN